MGASHVFRRLIKDFSIIVRSLNDNVQRDMELDWLDPTNVALDAFNTINSKSVESSVLTLPQPHRPCMIISMHFDVHQELFSLQSRNDSNRDESATICSWCWTPNHSE